MVSSITNPDIQPALDMINIKAPIYNQYIDYYEGRQQLNFATVKWRAAFGSLFKQFADNLCAPIVDAAADRLKITAFTAVSGDSVAKEIDQIWRQNRMDRKAGAVHEHCLKVGDAYVIIWPDADGFPVFTPNPAHQMCIYYADDGETPLWAAKLWRVDSAGTQTRGYPWRLNLYYPNSIEKYVTRSNMSSKPSRAGAFEPFPVPGEVWPLPNPYSQVPVFHFANQPEMGVWGKSELWDIVPLQDALNKSIADMLVAMEYVSLPQRWATGLEVEVDPQTNQPIIPLLAAINRMWSNPDPEGRFGQFEQANLEHFSKVQNDLRLEMARISRTPLHYLSLGGSSNNSFVSSIYPSGESQKVAEAPFVSKLEDRQTTYGDTWENAVAFALKIAGLEVMATDIETTWLDAKPRSETDDITNAIRKYKELGLPIEVVLEEIGYSKAVIDRVVPPTPPVQAPVQQEEEEEMENAKT